jgi:hypothetical protein
MHRLGRWLLLIEQVAQCLIHVITWPSGCQLALDETLWVIEVR